MGHKTITVFFDLDGTLLDVSQRHYRVYSFVCENMGGEPLPQGQYWKLKRDKATWEEILPMSRLAIADKEYFLDGFRAKIESLDELKQDPVFPESYSVLKKLSETHDCYVVSLRRNRKELILQLEHLGILPYIKDVLSGHSEKDGSDVKSSLIKAVPSYTRGVIVGDTETDILTAKQLNIPSIAVLSGIRSESFLKALTPDFVVPNVSHVASVIASLVSANDSRYSRP